MHTCTSIKIKTELVGNADGSYILYVVLLLLAGIVGRYCRQVFYIDLGYIIKAQH